MKNKNISLTLILSLFILLVMLAYNLHYYYYITNDLVELGISNEEIIKRLDLFYNFAAVQLAIFIFFGIMKVAVILDKSLN